MRKTIVIALREYAAAVRTKGFVVSLILMPVMMLGGVLAQRATRGMTDLSPRTCAVIDRSPGHALYDALEQATATRDATGLSDPGDDRQIRPRFALKRAEPAGAFDSPAADQQRFNLSQKVRSGDLFAFVEIGPDILSPKIDIAAVAGGSSARTKGGSGKSVDASTNAPHSPTPPASARRPAAPPPLSHPPPPPPPSDTTQQDLAQDALRTSLVRYWSNQPGYMDLQQFIQRSLVLPVYNQRLLQRGINAQVTDLLPPVVVAQGLATRDAAGQISYEQKPNPLVVLLMPIGAMMLLLVVVLVGASPLTMNIVEEKQLRIGEVLLGSVSAFELMLGKLLGGVATALTLGVLYIAGAMLTAWRIDALQFVSLGIIGWFLLFSVIASLMYGALFVAAGSAATNVKEAQALVTPVMLVVVLPLIFAGQLVTDPSGPIARFGTFFPLSAPLITMMRLTVAPGLPAWQALLAAFISCVTTVALVWIAGRIFRVGFLATGKGASPRELLRWVWTG